MSTLILGRSHVAELLDMKEALGVVGRAFRDYASGSACMPPKVYIELEKGDFRAMPGALPGAAGVKWVSVYPSNCDLGLPTVMAVIIYSDPTSGYPLAIMDATEITAYRTAAASALASKYLARSDSRTLGLIGAGHQAHMHLVSHALIFPLELIRVSDIRPEAVNAFIRDFPQFKVESASDEDVSDCDIVCTLTPSRGPIIQASWIKPGTHINAVGADAEGKQELDPQILQKARVVVDDMIQATHSGEINVPIRQGLFQKEQIWGALGEIISGIKPGRKESREITLFDSTGLAIEDLATARLVYQKAKECGGYPTIDLV